MSRYILLASRITAAALVAAACLFAAHASADHACDPVADQGWSVMASHETIAHEDSPPYRAGSSDTWYVDRTTTMLPLCNYFNAIGIYSMRSYSLSPETSKERIRVCAPDSTGHSVAIAPYAGPCPPNRRVHPKRGQDGHRDRTISACARDA